MSFNSSGLRIKTSALPAPRWGIWSLSVWRILEALWHPTTPTLLSCDGGWWFGWGVWAGVCENQKRGHNLLIIVTAAQDPKLAPQKKLPGPPLLHNQHDICLSQAPKRCERGLEKAPPTDAEKTEGGGIKWRTERNERKVGGEKHIGWDWENSTFCSVEFTLVCSWTPAEVQMYSSATQKQTSCCFLGPIISW